uniref:hypothetical protein n=1 Tax=Olsenella phocaeensis TaxID=1852385 RepID=UPI001F2981A5
PTWGGKALAGAHVVVPVTARAWHARDAYIGVGYAHTALGQKMAPVAWTGAELRGEDAEPK